MNATDRFDDLFWLAVVLQVVAGCAIAAAGGAVFALVNLAVILW